MELKESQQMKKKTYPEGTVFTMLKFERSDRDTNSFIGFVSQDTKTGQVFGRKNNDRYPKKIVIVDTAINYTIIPGLLYRCTLIPMREGKPGYIAIEATPYQFKATIKINYIPKAVYQVVIEFGQKKILFDPKDGRKASVRTLQGVLDVLSKRMDIEDINGTILDFKYQAGLLLDFFKNDGYYVKEERTAV